MSKHTPGQWEAIKPKKEGKHWTVGARGVLGGKGAIAGALVLWNIAMIDNGAPGDTLDTEEANARLIAAAPDLLAACKAAHALLRKLGGTNHDPEYSELASAIQRAEGRTT